MNIYNTHNQNTNTFVISLDSIDLSYIPTTFNRSYHDKVTPIWTKGNLDLRNNEYFEVEIRNKEDSLSVTEEEVTDVNDDVIDYTICHVCDLNVPKPYLNEHNMSAKHKTQKKVIEVALKRMNNNINHAQVIYNVKQNEQDHFCSSCVAVIKLKDKKEHESSVVHKNSLIVDKLLQDFLVLYSNNEDHNLDSNGNYICNDLQIDTNNSSNSANKMEQKMEPDNSVQKYVNSNIGKSGLIHINDCVSRKTEDDTEVQNKDVIPSCVDDMKRYIQVMNEIYCVRFDITVIDNINLEISTLEGSRVKVPAFNFLGLKQMNEKHLLCHLCQEFVITSSKEQHIYGNLHMKKVSTLFKNKHCIRIIDLSLSHCVICNMIIENSDTHVLCNNEHIRLLEEALVSDIKETHHLIPSILYPNFLKVDCSLKQSDVKESEERKNVLWSDKLKTNCDVESKVQAKLNDVVVNHTEENHPDEPEEAPVSTSSIKYCIICEIDVLAVNLKVHMNSTRHKINTEIKNLEVHYLMEIVDQEELKCLICLCPVKNNSAAVQRHLLSQKHVKLYNKLLTDNYLKDLKNCKFFCLACRVQVCKIDELSHTNKEDHKEMIMEMNVANVASTSSNTIKTDDTKPINTSDQYFCVVCNLYVPNINICILIHNKDERHLKNINKAKALSDTAKNNNGVSSENLNNTFDIHYHMTHTNQSNPLYCIVCDVHLTLHEKNMYEHIKGNNHRTNYQCILDTNYIISDNDILFCELCSVHIGDELELIHCKCKKHLKNLELHKNSVSADKNNTEAANIKTNATADIDNNNIVNTNNISVTNQTKESISDKQLLTSTENLSLKPSVTDGNKPSTSTNNLLHSNKIKRYLLKPTECPNTLLCSVCNVKVPNNEGNIVTYLRGRNHCNNYKALLKQNNIEESDEDFKCGLCEIAIPNGTELNHIDDAQHKLYITTWHAQKEKRDSVDMDLEIENIYKCSICNVKLSNNDANITEHNTGSHHILMAKSFTDNKLSFKDGEVFCGICEILIPQSNVSAHLETVKHIIEKHFCSS